MKLTPGQKRVLYQLIALGTRPREIMRKFNKQFPTKDEEKPLESNQLAAYSNNFKALGIDEQISFLPHNMQSSFAVQEVRINDDIKDLEKLNEELDKKDQPHKIEIIRAKLSIKNRIGQELGQVAAFAKGGIGGNLNVLQMQINKFRINLNKFTDLAPEDRLALLKKADIIEANAKAIK